MIATLIAPKVCCGFMAEGDAKVGPGTDLRQRVFGESPRTLVAFDFDGTLTVADSFTAFLRWRSGWLRWAVGMARLLPATLVYLVKRDRGRIKAAAVRVFLRGTSRAELAQSSESFADHVWVRFMRPDALAVWEGWRAKGATLVIVTASPEVTVAPFARRLGADVLLGTPLDFDASDRVTGAFAGENCRGEEKVTRLRAAFGEDLRLVAAYGDTSGDSQMLAIADQPGFKVFKARP
jgi:phosphatidylglycerophosphatase C